jgi:hypothetical protein
MEEKYKKHITRNEEASKAKQLDKKQASAKDNNVSMTFDLQCVLQIPSSNVSLMYYSRKLNLLNLTIYEAAPPNRAFCFPWTEINGKRGSSEIGTCLMKWINGLPPHVTQLPLFSDTCGGQNRNQHISALMLFLVRTSHLEVMESGHTHMEVDSMHSTIENEKKFVPVYTVHDWLNIFRKARLRKKVLTRLNNYISMI